MKSSQIIGLDSLQKKLQKLHDLKVDQIVGRASKYLADQTRITAPVDKGTLKASITFKVESTAKGVIGKIFTPLEYAPYVEFGTGPTGQENHAGISPKVNPRYSPTGWSYYDPVLKKWIYTKGQKAQPFMYTTFKKNKKKIKEYIANGIKEEMRKIKK